MNVLPMGAFRLVGATDHVLAYERRLGNQRGLSAFNMNDQAQVLPAGKSAHEALLSTYLDDPDPLIGEDLSSDQLR